MKDIAGKVAFIIGGASGIGFDAFPVTFERLLENNTENKLQVAPVN